MGINKKDPDASALTKCFEICAGDLGCLQYIQTEVDVIKKKFSSEEVSQTIILAVNDTVAFANYVATKRENLKQKLWSGTISPQELSQLRSDYFNYQDMLAQKKLQAIDEKVLANKDITMYYDINDKSEFVRGYVSNDEQLNDNDEQEKKIIELYDQCFHSWLVANKMSSQNGVIYDTTKLDKKGNYINKAKPEDVVRLINDPVQGLGAAVMKQRAGLPFVVQQMTSGPQPDVSAQV